MKGLYLWSEGAIRRVSEGTETLLIPRRTPKDNGEMQRVKEPCTHLSLSWKERELRLEGPSSHPRFSEGRTLPPYCEFKVLWMELKLFSRHFPKMISLDFQSALEGQALFFSFSW